MNASIRRHLFSLLKAAFRTGDCGFEDDHFSRGNKASLSVSNSLLTVAPVASS